MKKTTILASITISLALPAAAQVSSVGGGSSAGVGAVGGAPGGTAGALGGTVGVGVTGGTPTLGGTAPTGVGTTPVGVGNLNSPPSVNQVNPLANPPLFPPVTGVQPLNPGAAPGAVTPGAVTPFAPTLPGGTLGQPPRASGRTFDRTPSLGGTPFQGAVTPFTPSIPDGTLGQPPRAVGRTFDRTPTLGGAPLDQAVNPVAPQPTFRFPPASTVNPPLGVTEPSPGNTGFPDPVFPGGPVRVDTPPVGQDFFESEAASPPPVAVDLPPGARVITRPSGVPPVAVPQVVVPDVVVPQVTQPRIIDRTPGIGAGPGVDRGTSRGEIRRVPGTQLLPPGARAVNPPPRNPQLPGQIE